MGDHLIETKDLTTCHSVCRSRGRQAAYHGDDRHDGTHASLDMVAYVVVATVPLRRRDST
jgi:hypothetical protein